MTREGADFLDLGAESSRPGSKPISEQEEIDKLIPVISSLVKIIDIPISVDTYKPIVAKEALKAGAKIINDITGLQKSPEMADVISMFGAGVILMHMKGSPNTMQKNPSYKNVVQEVKEFLEESVKISKSAGISPDQIAVDPGIGRPILIGVSRKSFIGNILKSPPEGRLEGSLAASVIGVTKGVSIVRTHDVKETRKAIKVTEAITKGESL